MSWVHEFDFARAVEFLVAADSIEGVVNICSPNPIHNQDLMRVLRRAWGAQIHLPVRNWMVEMGAFLLRTESELILKSRRVIPGRLCQAGFSFRFADWETAAQDLVRRWREMRSRGPQDVHLVSGTC